MTSGDILTLNAGSATLKFAVFRADAAGPLRARWRGHVDRIGRPDCSIAAVSADGERYDARLDAREHAGEAFDDVLSFLGSNLPGLAPQAVSHRVVHGGTRYANPVVVDERTIAGLRALEDLAPLHQPHNIDGIVAAMHSFPGVAQVACFDTAFHRGQPRINDLFALPRDLYEDGVRRYGFHGLSYEYVSARLPGISPRLAAGRTVVAHLGSGASMCAVHGGRPVTSTMGFTALDGLPMGTRCGQIDPGVLLWLQQSRGMNADSIADLLYRRSGLLGLSGLSADMRELEASDDPSAIEAIDYFVARVRRETGALAAALGGIDGLVFTAGIGEHSSRVRAEVLRGLEWLGFRLDDAANADPQGTTRLTTADARTEAWLVPTDEEAMLAEHARRLLAAGPGGGAG